MDAFRIKVKQNCSFLPILVIRYLGVSVKTDDSFYYKIYSWFILAVASTYPLNNIVLMYQHLDNFDIVTNSLFNSIGGLAAFLKLMVIANNRKELYKLLKKIEKMQEILNVEKWGQQDVYRTNKLFLSCLTGLCLSLLCFYVGTFISKLSTDDYHQWSLPISDVSFIDRTYSPNYEIAWIYQVIAVSVLAPAFCVSDFLIAGAIADTCLQLKILQHRIIRVINDYQDNYLVKGEDDHSNNTTWTHLHPILKDLVVHHLYLIDIVADIEGIFNPIVFLDVMGNTCMICFACYCASVLPMFDFNALQVYLEVSAITTSLFFTCFWGNELFIESLSIADACYKANFIGTNLKFQKGLQLIIMRSQKSLSISVGKFTTLSIGVFVWIIRNSYTYFMVLRKSKDSESGN